MKFIRTFLPLFVVALLATFTLAKAGSFDSETATIQKSGAHSAKVMVGKETYTAPVMFDDGADWSCVKDHYEVDPAVVSGLGMHKVVLKIGTDGKASFAFKKK